MNIRSKKIQLQKIFFITVFSILILSGSITAQTITLCNRSGVDMRAARFILRDSSIFGFDCGGFGTEGCRSWLWNWKFIGNGSCDEYITGNFSLIYFAVQLKDKDGNWYSTSYSENSNIINSYDVGWSGLNNRTMCVKDNTYGYIYDRIIKGMSPQVSNEVCQSGYSKVAVNLLTQTDSKTNYTVTVPYESPPIKNYPNVIRNSDGNLSPVCGYRFINDIKGDFRVELKSEFIEAEGGVRPAKGYRWLNYTNSSNCTVELIPTASQKAKKPQPKKRTKKP